jgi:hypothetical protein
MFFTATAGCTYLLLHDERLVVEYLDQIIGEPPEGLTAQRLEAVREATLVALRSPGMKTILSVRAGGLVLLNVISYCVILSVIVGLVRKSLGMFRTAILLGTGATAILTLGAVINLLVRVGLQDLDAVAGVRPLIGRCVEGSVGCYVAKLVDVFTVWYLTVVGLGLSAIGKMNPIKVVLLVFSTWAVFVLCSFLTDTGAGWTM